MPPGWLSWSFIFSNVWVGSNTLSTLVCLHGTTKTVPSSLLALLMYAPLKLPLDWQTGYHSYISWICPAARHNISRRGQDNIKEYIYKHLDGWKYAYYSLTGRFPEQYPPPPECLLNHVSYKYKIGSNFHAKSWATKYNDLTHVIVTDY